MASDPVFAVTPRVGTVAVTAANTNRDGTGTLATVITGAASGTKINEVVVCATGTTTAGMIRLYVSDGTNHRLVKELDVTALTPAATVKAWTGTVTFANLVLPSASWTLRASTHNAENFVAVAYGGDL